MKANLADLIYFISGSPAASILLKVSLITALALIGTRMARRSRASIRHLLLTASFLLLLLLPIVSLLAPPVRFVVPVAEHEAVRHSQAEAITYEIEQTTVPDSRSSVATAMPRLPRLTLSQLLFAGWLAGATLFLIPVLTGLLQTRVLRRSAIPWREGMPLVNELANEADIQRQIDVLLHPAVPGPMTCGVLRPAIVLPLDAQSWSTEDLSRAIVHELEHVRRGDWISRCFARILCALYWFHPLVWVQWRRFVLEAERACDDVVLGHAEATAYADQLVILAQRLLTAHHPPIPAMANRYDLAQRVSALLDPKQQRGRAGLLWIGLACALAILATTVISPLYLVARVQNAPGSHLKFDVASVKPCNQDDFTIPGQRRQEFTASPGRVIINCIPLRRIIFFAYAGVGNLENPLLNTSPSDPDHIRGGPGWLDSNTYVIEGKTEGTFDRTVMMGPMLRALLEERFQLKTHREREEVGLYAMTVAKGGLKLKPIKDGECVSSDSMSNLSQEERLKLLSSGQSFVCGSFTAVGNGINRTWSLGGETLTRFANQTLSGVLDRFVIDQTGIDGAFNIHIEFGLDENIREAVFGGRPPGPLQEPPDGVIRGPSIFTALEEQLGLKLEKTRGPREYLVIDKVEKPEAIAN